MLKRLDFGSGYRPTKYFYTSDICGFVDYYFDPISYKLDTNDKFDFILVRNVLHHIRDLNSMVKEFYRILSDSGKVVVIELSKENYKQNYVLDYIWYRFVIPRYEIWFSKQYRNYENVFINNRFILTRSYIQNEKEIKIFMKGEIKC